jgi:hypothetical protein
LRRARPVPYITFNSRAAGIIALPQQPTAAPGALGYGGDTFNHIALSFLDEPSVSLFNAVDSYGVESAVSLTVNCSDQLIWNSGPAGPDSPQTLLSQYLYSGGQPFVGTFTLANLSPEAPYKLYLYGGDGNNESKDTLFNVTGGTADEGIQTNDGCAKHVLR